MAKKIIVSILLALVLIPFTGFAQATNQTESKSFVEAKQILQKMSNYLSEANGFSFQAEMVEDKLFENNHYIHATINSKVIIKRPDKVYADIKSDYNHKRYWYDGKKITLLTVPANFYATAKATGNIDEMTDFVDENFGVNIPLATLAFDDSYAVLMDGVINGYYTGIHNVNGVPCHQLLFINEDAEWQIWIEDGSNSVPRKYAVKYSMDNRDYHFVARISHWTFNEYTPDEMFNFIAPADASVIEFVK